MAKKNLPNIPIYIGDWERDCNVLSLESEAAWMRIVFKLWTKGKQNAIKIPTKSLQNLWRCSAEKMREILDDLIFNEIAEINENERFVEFTCRRFVKENKISKIRSDASKRNQTSNKNETKPKQKANKNEQNPDNEIDNEDVNKIKDEIVIKLEKEKIEFQKIIDIFNSVCNKLSKVQKLTPARKSSINARIEDYNLQTIGDVFQKVKASNFLNGENKEGWKASFDWVMNPNNFTKILEGNYENRTKTIGESKYQASDSLKGKISEKLSRG